MKIRFFLFFGLTALSISCRDAVAPHIIEEEPEIPSEESELKIGEIRVLQLTTYDGSGEVVHPDFVRPPMSFNNRSTYLAITPYPKGNAKYENPSIFSAANEYAWIPVNKASTPIAFPKSGHLSDPDVVYNYSTNELWVYYREANSNNEILLTRSSNGVEWTKPQLVLSAPSHQLISPSVVRHNRNEWIMWTVNGGSSGCSAKSTSIEMRLSEDGIHWGNPTPVTFDNGSISPWHLEVQWIPSRNEYWSVYNGKTPGSCTTPVLYFATSKNGVTWNVFPTPLLQKGAIDEFNDVVYRSTFEYNPHRDEITFWYSGAKFVSPNYHWKSAVQLLRRSDVYALANAEASNLRRNRISRDPSNSSRKIPIPLTDDTAP